MGSKQSSDVVKTNNSIQANEGNKCIKVDHCELKVGNFLQQFNFLDIYMFALFSFVVLYSSRMTAQEGSKSKTMGILTFIFGTIIVAGIHSYRYNKQEEEVTTAAEEGATTPEAAEAEVIEEPFEQEYNPFLRSIKKNKRRRKKFIHVNNDDYDNQDEGYECLHNNEKRRKRKSRRPQTVTDTNNSFFYLHTRYK
jgi:hypothetical protein